MAKQWKYKPPKRSLYEQEASKRFSKILHNDNTIFTNIHTGKKLKGKIILSRWQQLDKSTKAKQDKFNKLSLEDQIKIVEKKIPATSDYFYQWVP